MRRKLLSLTLALVMCLMLLPTIALAADGDFMIEDGVLIRYNGPGGNVVIPAGVTNIGKAAFSRCKGMTSVTIPDSVTEIGSSAFNGCTGLTNVTIPDSVTEIGNNAFNGCTGLTSMFIPDSVTGIWAGAFSNCTGLTAIEVGANNQSYISVDGVLMSKEADTIISYPCGKQGTYTVPASVTNILPYAFSGCTGLTYFYVDPANKKYISVNGILRQKDWNTLVAYPSIGIKEGVYTVPEGISEIEHGMMDRNSSLTGVIIPEGVEKIDVAFYDCENLTWVTIPSTVRSIDPFAFSGCRLRDVYFAGSKAQWEALRIESELGDKSTELTNAIIHYNSTGPGTSTPSVPDTQTAPTAGGFADVPADQYYAEPVVWAVNKGITNGTGNNQFSPDQDCTNAQILTFLWRAKGEPKPTAAVTSTDYYAVAVQWAKEQGVTDSFSAEVPCTRAMVVTYLWKLAGSPNVGSVTFSDVPASADYSQAVAWALEKGITTGTSATTFSPDEICSRGQIVTFLYRNFA